VGSTRARDVVLPADTVCTCDGTPRLGDTAARCMEALATGGMRVTENTRRREGASVSAWARTVDGGGGVKADVGRGLGTTPAFSKVAVDGITTATDEGTGLVVRARGGSCCGWRGWCCSWRGWWCGEGGGGVEVGGGGGGGATAIV